MKMHWWTNNSYEFFATFRIHSIRSIQCQPSRQIFSDFFLCFFSLQRDNKSISIEYAFLKYKYYFWGILSESNFDDRKRKPFQCHIINSFLGLCCQLIIKTYVKKNFLLSNLLFLFFFVYISMSSRGATPGLHHRTGTQGSLHRPYSLAIRSKRSRSFHRDEVKFRETMKTISNCCF